MKFIRTPVKGMNDFLPSDMRPREHLLSIIKEASISYGFLQIETPVMEHIENLTSKQGGDNEKLIFKVLKRGAALEHALSNNSGGLADNGLRYDLTVPLARYYAYNKEKLPIPFKAFQIGNVWRADNPQKGRFRQFLQCDIDILGDSTNLAEIELIAATSDILSKIFQEVNITDFTIHLNDRQILRAIALYSGFQEGNIDSVLITLDKFDKIGIEGIRNELTANGYDEKIIETYLSVYDNLSTDISCNDFCKFLSKELLPDSVVHNIDEIIACVRAMINNNVKIVFNPTLVRGMGYYTGPIFEISITGYNFSIAGGGRYDTMIGKFCGQDVCASGFSIGFERIITIIKDASDGRFGISKKGKAFLIDKGVSIERKMEIFAHAKQLREEGMIVTVQPLRKNPKIQIEKLEEEGFTEFQKVYRD